MSLNNMCLCQIWPPFSPPDLAVRRVWAGGGKGECFNVVPGITAFTEQKPPFDCYFDGGPRGGGVQENKAKTMVWPGTTQRESWWESRFQINGGMIIYHRCWLTPFWSRNNARDKGPILGKEQINEGLWILWELALRGNERCQPTRVWHVEADRRRPLLLLILSWTQLLLAVCWKNNACNNSAFMPGVKTLYFFFLFHILLEKFCHLVCNIKDWLIYFYDTAWSSCAAAVVNNP